MPKAVKLNDVTPSVLEQDADVWLDTSEIGGSGDITSPLTIPDCALWLDASDATTINAGSPSDNAPVSAWADKSGNGYAFNQAVVDNKPLWKSAGYVQFVNDPNAQFLSSVDVGLRNALANVNGFTFAGYFQWTGTLSSNETLFAAANSDTGILVIGDAVLSGISFIASNAASDHIYAQYGLTVMAPQLDQMIAVAQAATWATIEAIDGSSISVSTAANGTPPAAEAVFIPTDNNQLNTSNVNWFECMAYSRALNARERRQLLEYLSAKWGTL